MRLSHLDRWLWLRRGAPGALIAFAIFWPSAVEATCSSHSVVLETRDGSTTSPLDLIGSDSFLPWSSRDAESSDQPAPCHGVLCSGNSGIPLPVTSSIPLAHGGQWAIFDSWTLPSNSDGFDDFALDANLRPIQGFCSIFHPPRS